MTISAAEKEFHLGAFVGFVRLATTQPDALERYIEETGDRFKPGVTPFDKLVDHATGADREFVRHFIDWCGRHYGRDYLPTDFVDRLVPEKLAA